MVVLTVEDIIKATGGKLLSRGVNSFNGFSIDSRTIRKGEMFFALKGPRFDGHDFLQEVISKSAAGAVVDREVGFTIHDSRFTIITVKDTLKALQDLAHFMRIRQNIPVIAITGSNGKTTTKEMIYGILSGRFNVLKNTGNLNNYIGVPLSFLKINPQDEVAVLEFGMNKEGEIRGLCEIVVPTHGVITNIGPAHIGELGSLESVRSAKLELLERLRVAVLNADDDFLMEGVRDFKGEIITFSINRDSHVRAVDVVTREEGSKFTLVFKDRSCLRAVKGRIDVSLNVCGIFNIYNAIAASAVSASLGATLDEIKIALEGYRAFPMRFEVIKGDKITIINDSYNANPLSMREALKEFIRFKRKGRLVAVLGDMKELGEFSEESHRALGKMLSEIGIDVFIAIGEMMRLAVEESQRFSKNGSPPVTYSFKDAFEAKQNIMDILREGDSVLVKGSYLMNMGKIIEGVSERGK